MTKPSTTSHLPCDPKQWVKDLESVWQARDGERAKKGYADDATFIFGANQQQSGASLAERPANWFAYATDLKINKKYIAHTDNCIVASWDSVYTDPETGKKICERGIEFFKFRNGDICEQQAWQHSWPEGEKPKKSDISVD